MYTGRSADGRRDIRRSFGSGPPEQIASQGRRLLVATGHAAAAPPSNVMTSRRRTSSIGSSTARGDVIPERDNCAMATAGAISPPPPLSHHGLLQSGPQVLGANLNHSESRRGAVGLLT
jgi:hypothetical protein